MLGFRIQDSGFRGAKEAFSIWHLAFRKFSCFCLSQFSKLFRHSREGGNPIFFFPKKAREANTASFGTTKMGFRHSSFATLGWAGMTVFLLRIEERNAKDASP